VGSEENGYLVPDLNKTMINATKKPSDTHIKILKEEILEDITKTFIKKILDIVTRVFKMHSRNFKTPKIKNMR
jgi:hypothetical protein